LSSTQPKNRFAHLPRVLGRALIAMVPAVLLVTFLLVHFSRHATPNRVPIAKIEFILAPEVAAEVSSAGLSPRPVFPYSVVPGGVRDAQELQKAASSDPVVAKHYSDFHIGKARTIQLERPVAMYVSYRRNNQVFWTRNKMMIPAGETLISDGENLARVRCGNRLSAVAAKPVAATDPDNEALETPEFIPPMLAELVPGDGAEVFPGEPGAGAEPGAGPKPDPVPNHGSPSPPVLPPFLGPGVSPHTISIPVLPPPPVNTAEPGSLSLLFVGTVFFAVLALLSLRRNS
jgi:hypothetical protein